MNWMVRQSTDLEVNMNSVERMIEYNQYEEEAPAVLPSSRPPHGWPSAGAIAAENLVVRCAALLLPLGRPAAPRLLAAAPWRRGASLAVPHAPPPAVAFLQAATPQPTLTALFLTPRPCHAIPCHASHPRMA